MSGRKLSKLLPIDEVATRTRVRRLLDSKISVKALVNPGKVGFPMQTFIGLRVQPERIDSVVYRLGEHGITNFVGSTIGVFDVITSVFSRSMSDLQQFLGDFLGNLQGIKGVDSAMFLKTTLGYFTYLPPTLLLDTNNLPPGRDAIDMKMIASLAKDGRVTVKELGNELSISDVNAHRRLKQLFNDRVISIRGLARQKDCGFPMRAIIGLEVDSGSVDRLAKMLSNHKQFIHVATCTGTFNVTATAIFKSHNDLATVLKDFVYPIEGIRESRISIVMEDSQSKPTFYVPRIIDLHHTRS